MRETALFGEAVNGGEAAVDGEAELETRMTKNTFDNEVRTYLIYQKSPPHIILCCV